MVRVILFSVACLFISLFTLPAYALNSVTATVDKNPAIINESVILNIVADDDVNRNALDTTPLLKDFIVGRVGVSSQTSMVNFSTTRTTRWEVILIPRKSGTITIPALTVEGKQTAPISLTVLSASSAQARNQQNIFITSELNEKQVYVQQLLTLTVKLHFNAELKRASLSEPSLPGATIEQIGKDKESDGIINGKRYRIIERTYAITPQQSGEFTLVAPIFSGEIMVQSRRRSNFLSFGETKPVKVLGEEIAVTILPIPDKFPSQAQWLPSEIITLHQEWQPSIDEFKVGEPITRTILLTAAGLSKAQLPKLVMQAPKGIKIYPDQAELNSTMSQERLVSQLRQNFALVASRPGKYQLPEITVSWWNTVTNRYQEATLAAQTITVLANDDMPADNMSASSNNQQAFMQPANDYSVNADNNQANSNNQNLSDETPIIIVEQNKWQWLFLGLWLTTALAWFGHVFWLKRQLPRTKNSEQSMLVHHKSNQHYYLALLAACKNNDAQQALALVLPWLNSAEDSTTEIATIEQAKAQINAQTKTNRFSQAVNDLQQSLYGRSRDQDTEQTWQGNSLLAAIQEINKQQKQANSTIAMQLNP